MVTIRNLHNGPNEARNVRVFIWFGEDKVRYGYMEFYDEQGNALHLLYIRELQFKQIYIQLKEILREKG